MDRQKPIDIHPLAWPVQMLTDEQLAQALPPRGPTGCALNRAREVVMREIGRRRLDWDWVQSVTGRARTPTDAATSATQ